MDDASENPSPPGNADLPNASPVTVPQALPVTWVVTPPVPGEVITSGATGVSYTMGEKIGEGHFGLVYSCVDAWNNNLAAKIMRPIGPPERVRAATEALISISMPIKTFISAMCSRHLQRTK